LAAKARGVVIYKGDEKISFRRDHADANNTQHFNPEHDP
jgi:hypothetical protein